MNDAQRSLDVSSLPSYKFSHHSLMWWGIMGMIAIEGTVFALAIGVYFYYLSLAKSWPLDAAPPGLLWGSLNLAILLVSILPNHWTKQAAEDGDESRMKIGLIVCLLFGIALLAIRALEFTTLNVSWDANAYGSIVWLLLGMHTIHLLTDVYDTGVLVALFFAGPVEGKRHVDVSENALYWYFVVYAWIPVYLVIYWAPRLTGG
jgi:heme/copper-type cytochrome/quinol oxidase subunit 3